MAHITLSEYATIHFDILQIGCGGNGGYITQRLTKLLSNFEPSQKRTEFTYTLVDLDRVETKNLQRQPFLPKDVGRNKAQVLADRYAGAYQYPIYYREAFIESVEALKAAFPSNQDTFITNAHVIRVLIGAVDNHASRKIMNDYFKEDNSLIYLDCGVDGVLLDGTTEEKNNSGYSGHCAIGVNTPKFYVPPVAELFPDILEDETSLLPSQSCGQNIVSAPQRMQANEMAALITMGYLNLLLVERQIRHRCTNFNARTNSARSVLLKQQESAS